MEGNSARLTEHPSVGGSFNVAGPQLVLKEFKRLYGDGLCTLPDFENELHVLALLQKYTAKLSFEIPRVVKAQKNKKSAMRNMQRKRWLSCMASA